MPITLSSIQQQMAQIVASVAKSKGVDPNVAVADAYHESGLNPSAVGDNGSSFGLFQLHRGGELGSLSPAQAEDPYTNANVALSVFAGNEGRYSDPGQLAAASERPAQPAQYAAAIDQLLQDPTFEQWGSGATNSAALAQNGSVTAVPVSSATGTPVSLQSDLSGILKDFPGVKQLDSIQSGFADLLGMLQWGVTKGPELWIRWIELVFGFMLLTFGLILTVLLLLATGTPEGVKEAAAFGIGLVLPESRAAKVIGAASSGAAARGTSRGQRTNRAARQVKRTPRELGMKDRPPKEGS